MKFSFIFIISLLFSVHAFAGVLKFKAEQKVWACPPGAHYILMECKSMNEATAPGEVKIDDVLGEWASSGEVPAYFTLMVARFNNVYIGETLSLTAFVGFSSDYAQNSEMSVDVDPKSPPKDLLIYGPRKKVGEVEAVPSLILTDITYTE
jgi:hypothetical protein